VNSYAVIAYATPVAAFLMGLLAVGLHRWSAYRRLSPEARAARNAQRDEKIRAEGEALEGRLRELVRENARLGAHLDQLARDAARERESRLPSNGTAPAR